MGDDATSTTSLELAVCYACNLRHGRRKLMCRSPGCEQFRGKLYLCDQCVTHCPECEARLHQTDLATVTGLPTLETYSSLPSKGEATEAAKGTKGAKGTRGIEGKGAPGNSPKGKGKSGRKGTKTAWSKDAKGRPDGEIVEKRFEVAGYAIGMVIGENGNHLESLKSSYPSLRISISFKEQEATFAGRRAHRMEMVIQGRLDESEQVDEVSRTIQMLLNRAGPSHKPPRGENVLIDVSHALCAKLVPANLEAYHVCPGHFLQTTEGGKQRPYFVLEKVPHAEPQDCGKTTSTTYTYCSDPTDWSGFSAQFHRCLHDMPNEKLSAARVSVRLGKLFFWGRKLGLPAAQMPGAIDQMSVQDLRRQWAARLKDTIERKFSDVLRKSNFRSLQNLQNITYYLKTPEDGAKMEVTFFDPVSAETKASVMRRIWACTSYRDVLELPDETVSTSRIAVARSVLECLLHPSHNEFEGCHCAMHFIKQSAEGLLARAEFRPPSMPIDEALRVRAPYQEASRSGASFVAKRESERLFRGDVCRLGYSPDFRLSINSNMEIDLEPALIQKLKVLDQQCRSVDGDKLIDTFHSSSLPLGWRLQCIACRDEWVWMDPEDTVEVNVSKVREVTCLSTRHQQSDDDNFEIRFSSEPTTKAIQGRHADAWVHTKRLLSTVHMLHGAVQTALDHS
ncbi:unnamed protein product [Effrenium voratum]|nr:unnamed protein product [Effrenium voratum]